MAAEAGASGNPLRGAVTRLRAAASSCATGLPWVKMVMPLNVSVAVVAALGTVIRPDFNLIVALLAVLVIRSGHRPHLQWLGLLLVFTLAIDLVWITVFGANNAWDWERGAHRLAVFCSCLNFFLKALLITALYYTDDQWSAEAQKRLMEGDAPIEYAGDGVDDGAAEPAASPKGPPVPAEVR